MLNIEKIQDGCVNLYKSCDSFKENSRSIELNATQARVGEAAIYPTSAVAIIWSKTAAFNFLKKEEKSQDPLIMLRVNILRSHETGSHSIFHF